MVILVAKLRESDLVYFFLVEVSNNWWLNLTLKYLNYLRILFDMLPQLSHSNEPDLFTEEIENRLNQKYLI